MAASHSNNINEKPSILFDPDKGFHELAIVRLAGLVVLIICATLTLIVIITSGKTPHLNANGLTELAVSYRVPVGFFTLSLPFFALMAASHRSEQTKQQMSLTRHQIARTDKQILITADQNNFSNFYKHIEEFEKFSSAHLKGLEVTVVSPRKLHNAIYPRARKGEFTVDVDFKRNFESNVDAFVSAFDSFETGERREFAAKFIEQHHGRILRFYNLTRGSRTGSQWAADGEGFFVFGTNVQDFVAHHISLFAAIDEILKFDGAYESSQLVLRLRGVAIDKLPTQPLSLSGPFNLRALMAH